MVVIDRDGGLVYQGAIDSIPSADSDDISKATNYVTEALKALEAGVAVAEPQTKAYGCGIKYAY